MKIGLVCPYNIAKGGGVQECVLAMQAELNKRGHETLIITPRPREDTSHLDQSILLVGTATDVKSPFHTTAQVSVSVDTNELDTMLETHNFDVIHFHEPWVPILSRQVLMRSQAANVATFHAKMPGTVMSRTIEKVITPYTKSVLKYFHAFSAVSEPAAAYVRTLDHTEPTLIPNGIDIKKYVAPKKRPTNDPQTILYIGRLERRKGLKYLLKAFKLLQTTQPQVQLILAGEGTDRAKLEQQVIDEDISGVTFAGHITEAYKLELLRTVDIFCSPALFGESFGIVLLEAMASGCVTVAGDNDGYAAVMQERGQLSLVDPQNVEDFARRLRLLLSDHDLQQLWREWSVPYAQTFAYPKIVDAYEKLYEQALKNKSAA